MVQFLRMSTAQPLLKIHYSTLRRGKHRLLLWHGQEADGSVNTRTPSKAGTKDEMGRLEKVCGYESIVKMRLLNSYNASS
jgi:hypothetical protein